MALVLVWWYTSIDKQINIINICDQPIWIYVNIFNLGLLESYAGQRLDLTFIDGSLSAAPLQSF